MLNRSRRSWGGWLAIALAVMLPACLNENSCFNQSQTGPTVVVPTAAPASPSPSASPVVGGTADVDNVGIYAFGYENDDDPATPACVAPADGDRINEARQYKVPAGCSLALTATAFNRAGNPIHLPAETPITWTITGPGVLSERPPTPFNRTYKRTGGGSATVTATTAGKTGTRGFANQ